MQRPNEKNRREIMAVAARLFAKRPYHEVRLDDVAAEARIGKGTLYVYFRSKENLLLTLVREGFSSVVNEIRSRLDDPALSAWDRLALVLDGFLAFATRYPHLFQLMRAGVLPAEDPALQRNRKKLAALVEDAIRSGIRAGELVDPAPRLTAQFVLSFVRGVILYGPRVDADELRDHLLLILRQGISAPRPRATGRRRAPQRRPATRRRA